MGTKHELSDLQGETVPGSYSTDLRNRVLVSLQQDVWAAQQSYLFSFSFSLFVFLLFFIIYMAVSKTMVYFWASYARPLSLT